MENLWYRTLQFCRTWRRMLMLLLKVIFTLLYYIIIILSHNTCLSLCLLLWSQKLQMQASIFTRVHLPALRSLLVINSCIFIFLFLLRYILASVTGQGGTLCPESCLHGEASKITSINETIGQEQSERAKLLVASHSTTPTINLQTMPGIVKLEFCNKVALHDSELCLAMGWVFFSYILKSLYFSVFKSFVSINVRLVSACYN